MTRQKVTRDHRARLRAGVIAASAIAIAVLAVAFFPWNILRGPLAHYFSSQLARPVSIGHLDVRLGWTTHVRMEDLTVGNAPWSVTPQMLEVHRLDADVKPLTLLSAAPRIPLLDLTEASLLLEKNSDGVPNWLFGDAQTAPDIRIGTIYVGGGIVRYRDPGLAADISVKVQAPRVSNSPAALHFVGDGVLRREPFHIEGQGSSLTALRNIDDPYQFDLRARAGSTSVHFAGDVVPADVENVHGDLQLQGKDLSQLYPFVPLPIPWTPPYKLSGKLTHQGARWSYVELKGTVGDSDLSGTAAVDASQARPSVTADLSSRRFNYKDLGGIVGIPPGDAASGVKAPEQRRETARRAASPRVLPDEPFELGKLRAVDADIKFHGTSVAWADAPIDNLSTHLVLKDGVIRFEPVDFGIGGGHVVGNLSLDASADVARGEGSIEVRSVELGKIFPKLASPKGSAGRFGGRIVLKSKGNTLAAMAAAANGEAAMIMRGGEASTLALVMTNLDLASAAALLLRGDETSRIHCAAGSFKLTDGQMAPQFLVIDTSAETIYGAGGIDFREEKYNLRLSASSKKASILALRGPILVGGTFKTPVVGPEPVSLTARVGAAAGLAAIAPPLALLALIDPGGAPDVDCQSLLSDTKMPRSAGGAKASPAPKASAAPAAR